jgi:predicted translin family RNA/ssDNA-binding protein
VVRSLPADIVVTESDFLMGLFDLTGEMMRFGVTAMAAAGTPTIGVERLSSATGTVNCGGNSSKTRPASDIVLDLRALRARFESLNIPRGHAMCKDLHKKIDTMQESVEKVERVAYGLLVRGSERPEGWMPDLSSGAVEVESY